MASNVSTGPAGGDAPSWHSVPTLLLSHPGVLETRLLLFSHKFTSRPSEPLVSSSAVLKTCFKVGIVPLTSVVYITYNFLGLGNSGMF